MVAGDSGAFIGADEQYLAILSGTQAALYPASPVNLSASRGRSKDAKSKAPAVLKRISFSGAPAASIFAGPAVPSLPGSVFKPSLKSSLLTSNVYYRLEQHELAFASCKVHYASGHAKTNSLALIVLCHISKEQ